MSTPINILNKIKFLLKLASSPNENEAKNAQDLANKLIEKYNVSHEELNNLKDKKAAYGDDELLFSSPHIIGWKNQLALGLAFKFDCQIVQEECLPNDGEKFFNYYAYGEDNNINSIKYAFSYFINKINNLIDLKCLNKSEIYIDSYCEGVVQAIRSNLEYIDFNISQTQINQSQILNSSSSNLTEVKVEKEKLSAQKTDISSQSFIKDIVAYFKGLNDGKDLIFSDDQLTLDSAAFDCDKLFD